MRSDMPTRPTSSLYNMVGKDTVPGTGLPACLGPWAYCLALLCFSFPTYKMGGEGNSHLLISWQGAQLRALRPRL